jgi:hypothetical protein
MVTNIADCNDAQFSVLPNVTSNWIASAPAALKWIVPRKPKPMPLPQCADPKRRFDATLRALLAVNKTDLQNIEEKLKAVRTELQKRKRSVNK